MRKDANTLKQRLNNSTHSEAVQGSPTEGITQYLQDAVDRYMELFGTAETQLHRLKVVYELTKAIISLNDFDELLKHISEETTKIFDATYCLIRLIEDDKLRVRASFGVPELFGDHLTLNIGEGIAGKAAQQDKTILLKRLEDLGSASYLAQHLNITTAICSPMRIGDQIIGTFGLYDKKADDGSIIPFTEDDASSLEGFASIAAIVIEKSMLYENALRQEREAVEAKKNIEELKEYLEGLIENSADAIVTTDLDGIVTSWNQGAEKIYGFEREEVIGRFLPFLPNFLIDTEKAYIEQVKRGETIKDIETVRKTKVGGIIDINLTLSPIKNVTGKVIGTCGIARDITERKRIQKDLERKNTELSRLSFISSAMRGTLELDKLLRMVLTAVTIGDGLGFNRALLFLLDEDRMVLKGAMGVGPSSNEEAWEIWSKLSFEQKSLHAIMEEIMAGPSSKDSFMDRICCNIEIPLDKDYSITRAVKEKKTFNVTDAMSEPYSDFILTQQTGALAYAVVPLISRDKVIGVLWVDNLYSKRPITDRDIDFLKAFTDQMSSAIENARLFEHVAQAEQELENIFESISDLVFINSSDYRIKRVNRAVLEKMGKAAEEIVGQRCFEVFHGTTEPSQKCPHHKTIMTHKSFIEELEEPQLGGTYLFSSSPLFTKAGDLLGTVHVVRDITEIENLRERVVSSERMAALGEMAAKVAHEIRNPLLSIGGFARRLEKGLDGEFKENARIIVDEVKRLEGILNNTLAFVKTDRLEMKAVNIEDILYSVAHLCEPALNERGNRLLKNIELPMTVSADPNRFKQALLNLLSNANQATEKGKIIIRAYKSTGLSEADLTGRRREQEEAVIEIADTGCGINEEDIGRIFDPFFTTRPAGTGLGLSITKKIVDEQGGRIEVTSALGKGTTFKIYLPLKED